MATNIDFSVESLSANLAREWFNSCMYPHMRSHVRRLAKGPVTLPALKGFHSCVRQRMFLHVGLAKEVFFTITARVRFMIRVNKFMRRKTGSHRFARCTSPVFFVPRKVGVLI